MLDGSLKIRLNSFTICFILIRNLMNKNKKEFILCILILIIITSFYEGRITLNKGLIIVDDFFTSDLMNDRYPVRVEMGRNLKEGHLLLWTNLIYCGFPLQANPESGILYPFNIILFGLMPASLAFNISLLLKFFLAAFFLLLYLRLIGINLWAALIGSVSFSWCGFVIGHIRHLNTHDAIIWIPLLLFALEKYHLSHKIGWIAISSVIIGVQFLAGQPQISYYTILLTIAYFLWREFFNYPTFKLKAKALILLALLIILGILIGLAQILPTYELTKFSERSGGVSFQFATQYSYYLPDLLTFFYPFINGHPGKATYKVNGIFWEDYGYVGIIPIIFAFLAVFFTIKKNKYTRFFLALLVISFILMLGEKGILYNILFRVVPGMNYFRFSNRFIVFVDLSLAILASVSISHLINKRKYLAYIFLIITVVDLFYMQRQLNPLVNREDWEEIPKTAKIIRQDKSLYRIFSIGGVESHIASYELASGWLGDLTPYIQQREMLQPSSNILYGISSADGYINLAPKHVIDLWGNDKQLGIIHRTAQLDSYNQRLIVTKAFKNIIDAFNVKYIISLWKLSDAHYQLIASPLGFYLYLNPSALSRVFLVPNAIKMSDMDAYSALVAGLLDLRNTVILHNYEGWIPNTANRFVDLPIGEIIVQHYSQQFIKIKVKANNDCWLVLSDTYYPGWKAKVDEAETKIYRANVNARAIYISKGHHDIIFNYEPLTFKIGLAISLITIIITTIVIIFSFKMKV